MDYRIEFKEKLGKMLFLEMDIEGFKRTISMPEYVRFNNKELYLPIIADHLTANANNEMKLKNLPIYYFIEGMFAAIGLDENLKYNEDYEIILDYIKDTESCIKGLISDKINKDKLLDGYILLKGYYRYSKDIEAMKKMLLVGESLREKDTGFTDILLDDIKYCEENSLKIKEAYLYKAIILRDKTDFKGARVAIHEFINNGGNVTDDIKILIDDVENISTYEKAIELIKEEPAKTVGMLLGLLDKFDKNPLIYYYLAVAYRRLEDYDNAITYLKESIKIESGILEVVVELGMNYACINDFESALVYFKKAFEASRDVEICTNIIMCYINMNKLEDAKQHLEIAKKLNKDDEIVKEIEEMFKKLDNK